MKLSSTVALTVAAVMAAGSAIAQTTPDQGNSDVFAVIWDTTTSQSVGVDLGINISVFNYAQTQSFTIDDSLTQLTSDLGGTATDFLVAAGNQNGTVPGHIAGEYEKITAASAPSAALSNGGVINGLGTLDTYSLSIPCSGPSNACALLTSQGNPYWGSTAYNNGSQGGVQAGINGQTFGAAPGTVVSWYKLAASDNTPTDLASVSLATAGTWGFNAATDLLTYTAPSAVPLPAALWLVLSGLGGLGAVARRRAIAA